jgi:hypothetical protein
MSQTTLEERMTILENQVRELREAMHGRSPASDWLERVIGSMKDEPAFEDVVKFGREFREAHKPADHQAP